ncbi:MAG: septation protein SpoVG family protein [Defluviitaleaceae bacterium]|nr:septation protein SpoVG family protein [Defluviitaleaceae bacterium]
MSENTNSTNNNTTNTPTQPKTTNTYHENNFKIDVTLAPIENPKGNLMSYANITINDIFAINNVRVMQRQSDNVLFVAMPQEKGRDDKYYDIAFPATAELRNITNKAVLDTYAMHKGLNEQRHTQELNQTSHPPIEHNQPNSSPSEKEVIDNADNVISQPAESKTSSEPKPSDPTPKKEWTGVSDDRVVEARKIDILDYLHQNEPYNIVQHSADTYKLKDHDSLKIYPSNTGGYAWKQHSNDKGGKSALDFMTGVRGIAFVDAVKQLTPFYQEQSKDKAQNTQHNEIDTRFDLAVDIVQMERRLQKIEGMDEKHLTPFSEANKFAEWDKSKLEQYHKELTADFNAVMKMNPDKLKQHINTLNESTKDAPLQQSRPSPIQLPPSHWSNAEVVEYLSETRAIDPEIINHCIDKGAIYQSEHHKNVVFVGRVNSRDNTSEIKYASIKGTTPNPTTGKVFQQEATGSKKDYPFAIPIKEQYRDVAKTIFVSESAIDTLSKATLDKQHPDKGHLWNAVHRISLAGVSAKGLITYLEQHPSINKIVLNLDNDKAGLDAALRITNQLHNQYPNKYDIDYKPPQSDPKGRAVKDFNDVVVHQRNDRREARAKAEKTARGNDAKGADAPSSPNVGQDMPDMPMGGDGR